MDKKMIPSAEENVIVEATPDNYNQIANFLNQDNQIHRHLDWFGTLDWLGYQPYLLLMKMGQIQSVLCATSENKDSAWVRTFVAKKQTEQAETWGILLNRAIQNLSENGIQKLAALALHKWFEDLLASSGFKNKQNIIVLEWGGKLPPGISKKIGLKIRPMHMDDLPEVQQVDQLAFPPLWQNSLASLTKAYEQPGISTVAVHEDVILGYQISTSMTIYGHLARLAVRPDFQRLGVAYHLVHDLLRQFDQQGFWRVTVNTQSNNSPSLKLYKQFGFKRTGEEIPVYGLML